jgi:hypothetical protein
MMSHTSDWAKPPSNDDMAKTDTPIMNMRRLPYRSPVRPPNKSNPPKVNEYPVMSHSRLANEKFKSWWMVGIATFTTVASSTIISCAAVMTNKARPKCLVSSLVASSVSSVVIVASPSLGG